MLYRNMFMKYQAPEDGEGGDLGGGDAPKTFTQAEVDAMIAESTSGLKNKVDELLGEKKTAAQKAKEAEAARIKTEQEAAKTAGELEKFEASLRGEFNKTLSERDAELEALRSNVLGSGKKAVLAGFQSKFIDADSVDIISHLVETTFENGEVKTQFKNFAGTVITTDAAEFSKWMQKHPTISKLMRADAATGGGAAGNKSHEGGANMGKKYDNPVDAKRAELAAGLAEKFK